MTREQFVRAAACTGIAGVFAYSADLAAQAGFDALTLLSAALSLKWLVLAVYQLVPKL